MPRLGKLGPLGDAPPVNAASNLALTGGGFLSSICSGVRQELIGENRTEYGPELTLPVGAGSGLPITI